MLVKGATGDHIIGKLFGDFFMYKYESSVKYKSSCCYKYQNDYPWSKFCNNLYAW